MERERRCIVFQVHQNAQKRTMDTIETLSSTTQPAVTERYAQFSRWFVFFVNMHRRETFKTTRWRRVANQVRRAFRIRKWVLALYDAASSEYCKRHMQLVKDTSREEENAAESGHSAVWGIQEVADLKELVVEHRIALKACQREVQALQHELAHRQREHEEGFQRRFALHSRAAEVSTMESTLRSLREEVTESNAKRRRIETRLEASERECGRLHLLLRENGVQDSDS